MKPIRMRTLRGRTASLWVVALSLAMAGTAVGQPKKGGSAPKGGTAAPKGGGDAASDEGIEIDQPAGSGSDGGGTIDMEEEEKPQGSLEADLQASDSVTAVKAGPVKKTPLSW